MRTWGWKKCGNLISRVKNGVKYGLLMIFDMFSSLTRDNKCRNPQIGGTFSSLFIKCSRYAICMA